VKRVGFTWRISRRRHIHGATGAAIRWWHAICIVSSAAAEGGHEVIE